MSISLVVALLYPKLIGSRFRVQARPGSTGCGYDIVIAYYGLGFPSPHLGKSGLGQGFKGYNCLKLHTIIDQDPEYPTSPIG